MQLMQQSVQKSSRTTLPLEVLLERQRAGGVEPGDAAVEFSGRDFLLLRRLLRLGWRGGFFGLFIVADRRPGRARCQNEGQRHHRAEDHGRAEHPRQATSGGSGLRRRGAASGRSSSLIGLILQSMVGRETPPSVIASPRRGEVDDATEQLRRFAS